MPLYQSICEDCEKIFEYIVPMEDRDKPVKCPKCDKEMIRLFPNPRFIIK